MKTCEKPAHQGWFSLMLLTLLLPIAYALLDLVRQFLTQSQVLGSPVYLAAGLGIGSYLVWGRRSAPGLWLGGAALHIFHNWSRLGSDTASVLGWGVALGFMGVGIAELCAWIVRRNGASGWDLDTDRKIITFMCISCPQCAVAPAILSAVLMCGLGVLPSSDWPIVFATRWVSFTLGAILVTPAMLMLFGQPRTLWRKRMVTCGIPLTLVASGMACFFYLALDWHIARQNHEFSERARGMVETVRDEMRFCDETLDSLRNFYRSSNFVDRNEFASFTEHTLEKAPYITTLRWCPCVSAESRATFEQETRAELPGFTVREHADHPSANSVAEPREVLFPSLYVAPAENAPAALGYDISLNPLLAAAIQHSIDTGKSVAAKDADSQGAYESKTLGTLFQAIYRNGTCPQTVAERRAAVLGVVAVTYDMTRIVELAHAKNPATPLIISLLDAGPHGKSSLLWSSELITEGVKTPFDQYSYCNAVSQIDYPIDTFGSDWVLRIANDFDKNDRYSVAQLWCVHLTGGLGLATLIGFLLVITGRSAAIEREVASRTASLKEMNQALEDARAEADRLNRSKSEFLANMSHEIRTPMTAILGFSENLLQEPGIERAPPERRIAIDTIRRNGEFLLEIINDILDLSKIEANRIELEKRRCKPSEIVADVIRLMEVRATAKNLQVTAELTSPVPETIESDPTRLRQILINLVGNAIKFTATGGVRIVLSLEEWNGESQLRFDVIDTGIGLRPDQVEKLFQPFSQADSSHTRKYGGTGLGLTISRRLAEMLGGDVTVTSEAGMGSTFTLRVVTGPIADVPSLTCLLAPTPVAQAPTPSANIQLQGRVLLAEDGPDNQRLISHVLRKAGAEVTLAENGQIAYDLATAALKEGNPFDVILMDMQMPVLDGYNATRRLRDEGYVYPIIALTAHAMAEDRDKCLSYGCDDFASKPIDRAQLLGLVAKHYDKMHTAASR